MNRSNDPASILLHPSMHCGIMARKWEIGMKPKIDFPLSKWTVKCNGSVHRVASSRLPFLEQGTVIARTCAVRNME
ncbi:hypothetical protein DITRI_Ditri01bG0033400 [Diplodiscus trichospermus]